LILIFNKYCVVFCFSSSCVPYVASLSGLSFFECSFGIIQLLFRICGHEFTYFILSSTNKNTKCGTQKRDSSLRFSSLSMKCL